MQQEIYIGADHAGLTLKAKIFEYLKNKGCHIIDLGTYSTESVDYPDYAKKITEAVAASDNKLGILVCGSGIGMSIAANRNPKIRAALCHNVEYAKLAREHNNANILVLGGRFLKEEEALDVTIAFLTANFIGGKHKTRVDKLLDI
jgi:ribose 5-phosphate isomerase B